MKDNKMLTIVLTTIITFVLTVMMATESSENKIKEIEKLNKEREQVLHEVIKEQTKRIAELERK